MPIFEYRCEHCGRQFETLVLPGGRCETECPECGAAEVKKLMSAGSARPQGIPRGAGGFKPPACPRSGR